MTTAPVPTNTTTAVTAQLSILETYKNYTLSQLKTLYGTQEGCDLQGALRDAGYNPGTIDCLPGSKTYNALQSFKAAQVPTAIAPTGMISLTIIKDAGQRTMF